ncbi:MAG: hypothetical protein GY711_17715 [bacterium]|nr:hypothetical protein [bacterium]
MTCLAILSLVLAPLALPQTPDEGSDAPCRLHGRLVDTKGAPVAGAKVAVHGWGANSERKQRYGVPKNWKDPEAVESDADGKYSVSFVPARAFQFVLDVDHEDYGSIGWRWSEIEPGKEMDLGESVLEVPGIVTGYIVDADGELLVEGWRVSAWHNWNSGMNARSSQGSHCAVDPDTGAFRIDDLPPGRLRLSARNSSTGMHIRDVWAETTSGEATEVELKYAGPKMDKHIVLTIFSRPFYTFEPAADTVHAVDASGKRHTLKPAPGRANDWHATGLTPGAYTVEIDDPRFDRWRRSGISTGTRTSAHLVGSAALQLKVEPPEGEEPLEQYGLRVTYRGANFSPNTFTVAEDGASAPADGLFSGIVPGDIELDVRAKGWPPQLVELGAVEAGETRQVSVQLTRGLTLAGKVVHADGTPAGRLRVQLTRGEYAGHDTGPSRSIHTSMNVDGKQKSIRIGYRDEELTTQPDGSFVFEGLGATTYTLRAIAGPQTSVDLTVKLEPGVETTPTITLPGVGSVELTLLLPDDAERENLSFSVREPEAWKAHQRSKADTPGLDENNVCRIEGVPATAQTFDLDIAYHYDESISYQRVELGELTVEAGTVTRATFDLRETYPVRGAFRLKLAGVAETRGAYVAIHSSDEENPLYATTWGQDEKGKGLFAAAPGEYRIHVTNWNGGWKWDGGLFELKRGGTTDFEVDVPIVERAIQFVDGDGTPLPQTKVTWWAETMQPGMSAATTDADGRATLSLPPGKYSFARTKDKQNPNELIAATKTEGATQLEWKAGDEALVVKLGPE